MYLLVGDDERSSEENSEAQLRRNETWLTEFKADQKYLGFFMVSFASYKNEVENSYFGVYDNIQKMIEMDRWVCFPIWVVLLGWSWFKSAYSYSLQAWHLVLKSVLSKKVTKSGLKAGVLQKMQRYLIPFFFLFLMLKVLLESV